MSSVKFNNKSQEVLSKVAIFKDVLPALMSAKIDAKMKTSGEVPLLPKSTKYAQRGALRSSIRSRKVSDGIYVVTAGENSPAAAYAAAQEFGVTRGYPIKNYSTPGTGPHWFRHAIDSTIAEKSSFVEQASNIAGLGIKE